MKTYNEFKALIKTNGESGVGCNVRLGDELGIFGNDYDTPDGTGVRDYIHVVDLAKGHVKALNKARTSAGAIPYNLGTGNGYSVLEIIYKV